MSDQKKLATTVQSKKVKSEKEDARLFELVRNALEKNFSKLGENHLEITSDGIFSENLKRALDDSALHILRYERISPDLTGFLRRKDSTYKEIITVEIKSGEITAKDVAKAKLYADMLDAKFSILISTKPLPEELRRFIIKRFFISRYPREPIVIAQFDERTSELTVDRELYYGSLPEPFKSSSI